MLWLASSILSATLVVPRPLPAHAAPPDVVTAGVVSCDDATTGGTLVQTSDAAYGNRFAVACGGGRLLRATFVHFGSGFAGPYAYRLRLFAGSCHELAATAPLVAPDAAAAPTAVEVDLAVLGWCVGADFVLALEPQSCAGPDDCFPAVAVDGSSDGDSAAHCGVVVTAGDTGPECRTPRSADGRYFDFQLRVEVDCDDRLCTTPVAARTWSALKRLYTDPAPGR